MLSIFPLIAALAAQEAPPDPPDRGEIDALEREAEDTLAQAEARIERADAIAAEIAELRARIMAAAERLRSREVAAANAAERLETLESEEAALLERLASERESLALVLAALQRIETGSPPALAVNPDDAAEAARAASLLANVAPQLEARARSVRVALDELIALREALREQRDAVAEAEAQLSEVRETVEGLIATRRDRERELRSEADDLSRRAAEIAAEAQSLDDLLREIRRWADAQLRLNPRRQAAIAAVAASDIPTPRLRPPPPAEGALLAAMPLSDKIEGMRFSDVRGQLNPPALGELVTGFQQAGRDGVARDGVWFETRPRATVRAPFDGVVVFAGNFQSLEGVLLINTSDGYTLVIGGMAAIYASEGQPLLPGEPIGTTPDRENPPPRLYFGIMRGTDQPEDPETWLRPEYRRG